MVCSGRILPKTDGSRAEAVGLDDRDVNVGQRRDQAAFDRRGILNQRAGVGHGPVQLADADLRSGGFLARDVESSGREPARQMLLFVESAEERAVGPHSVGLRRVGHAG